VSRKVGALAEVARPLERLDKGWKQLYMGKKRMTKRSFTKEEVCHESHEFSRMKTVKKYSCRFVRFVAKTFVLVLIVGF